MTKPPQIAGSQPAIVKCVEKKCATSLRATAGSSQKPKIHKGISQSKASPKDPMVSIVDIVIASKSTSQSIMPKATAKSIPVEKPP